MTLEPLVTAAELADTVAILGNGQPTNDSWTPLNLNTLPDQPPTRPTIAGIVYPGKRHVFSGPPESAKTLAAYAILIYTVRQGHTGVLIDFEMGGYDARARLRELGATSDEISRIAYIEPDEPATDERIARLILLHPTLVIVDAAAGAYNLEGLDDNKRSDVEKLSRLYVTTFWRAGIATIHVDHVAKDTETRGRFAIGSERKLGGADVHLGFDTITPISRGTNGRYKITTHKDRGGYLKRGHLADLNLESHPETHQISWSFKAAETTPEDQPFRPTKLMERVSSFVAAAGEPLSYNRIVTGVKGQNDKAKRDAIAALVREGFVVETPGERGARCISHVRIYREDDPTCNPENTDDVDSTSAEGTPLRLPLNQAKSEGPQPPQPTSARPQPQKSNGEYDLQPTSATSADLGGLQPAEVKTTSAGMAPPYGGQQRSTAELASSTSASTYTPDSWLDDLAATVDLDQPAGTLDEPTP